MIKSQFELLAFHLSDVSPVEELNEYRVNQIDARTFHIQFKEKDPYDGVDYKITFYYNSDFYVFHIYDSVWGDNVDIIYDHDLNYIETR